MDIRVRYWFESIDLKTRKTFVSYLWMTKIMVGKILGSSRSCSITCITQITLFLFVLLQISFGYISWNLLSKKLTRSHKSRKIYLTSLIYTQWNLATTCVNDCSKAKSESAWMAQITNIVHCSVYGFLISRR